MLVHVILARESLGTFGTLHALLAAVDLGVTRCVARRSEVALATKLGGEWTRVGVL